MPIYNTDTNSKTAKQLTGKLSCSLKSGPFINQRAENDLKGIIDDLFHQQTKSAQVCLTIILKSTCRIKNYVLNVLFKGCSLFEFFSKDGNES